MYHFNLKKRHKKLNNAVNHVVNESDTDHQHAFYTARNSEKKPSDSPRHATSIEQSTSNMKKKTES